ncbi:MAG: RidA family protein [bacterium]
MTTPGKEVAITVCGEDVPRCARRLREELDRQQARPLSLFVFGGLQDRAGLEDVFPPAHQGISWFHGDSSRSGQSPVSLQAFAVVGAEPVQVVRHGTARGFVFEDDAVRVCRLAGVVPASLSASREEQTREVLALAESLLNEAGFRFADTVRTWFYLDHLLEWYDGFNAVRTGFYRDRGVLNGLIPASTGIGAGNSHGSALSCDVLAVAPRAGRRGVQGVVSPLQDSALNYRSSFSRAVEIEHSRGRQLLVSGTASIDREGRTAHAGNPGAQIDLTLRVVEALLASRGMGWSEVTRGIAYFKRLADRPLMDQWWSSRGITPVSLAIAEADICRHDLDFEIEVDAVGT